jgi:hypothetical protein
MFVSPGRSRWSQQHAKKTKHGLGLETLRHPFSYQQP